MTERDEAVRWALYPYKATPNGQYELRRDGKLLVRGTEGECWQFIHQTASSSVSHALTHEGYTMTPVAS